MGRRPKLPHRQIVDKGFGYNRSSARHIRSGHSGEQLLWVIYTVVLRRTMPRRGTYSTVLH